jgi:hypothetical protein
MPALTVEYKTEAERLILEAAIAYATTLQTAAMTAPGGSVLDLCEQIAVGPGKAFLRETLEHAVQGRIEDADKKGGSRGPARDATGLVGTKGRTDAP